MTNTNVRKTKHVKRCSNTATGLSLGLGDPGNRCRSKELLSQANQGRGYSISICPWHE
ncbi:hypothetical protein BaRGS_00016703, partial [Batillaria attramentaria]